MMYRKDKKKLPVALLPNGTGNDFAACLGMPNFDMGLQYLAKGNIIKCDVLEALMDFETAEDVEAKVQQEPEFVMTNHLRYSFLNTSILLSGLIAKNATPLKPYFGKLSYSVSSVKELLRMQTGQYEFLIDDKYLIP